MVSSWADLLYDSFAAGFRATRVGRRTALSIRASHLDWQPGSCVLDAFLIISGGSSVLH